MILMGKSYNVKIVAIPCFAPGVQITPTIFFIFKVRLGWGLLFSCFYAYFRLDLIFHAGLEQGLEID